MFNKIKSIIIVFTAGALLGAGGTYLVTRTGPGGGIREVTVTRLSGEEISHRSFSYRGSSVQFITEAHGAGIASTEIPKENIPEAAAWMRKTHAVQASVYYQFHAGILYPFYGLAYYHRFGIVSLGAGVMFSASAAGIQAGVMYWW